MKLCMKLIVGLLTHATLIGCGGEGPTANEAPVPSVEIPQGAICVPGEPRDFVCSDGTPVSVVCAKNGKSFSASDCPPPVTPDAGSSPEASPAEDAGTEASADSGNETDADAAEINCGPGQPVGHVVGTDCCDDGTTGYTVCQAGGQYEGRYGCQQPQPDAGDIYPAITVNLFANGALYQTAGSKETAVNRVEVCAFKKVSLKSMELYVANSMTQGSNGTMYFSNSKLKNDVNQTAMGHEELVVGPGESEPRRLQFNDPVVLEPGTCYPMTLVTDLAEHEDAPGEFIGQAYQIQVLGIGADFLDANGEADHPVTSNEVMWNNTQGQWFRIQCNPGTFNPCDCGNGITGQAICGVNYAPLACDCPVACPTPGLHGSLTVTEDSHPAPAIVVAGKDVWVPMARYKACATGEDVKADKIGVQWQVSGQDWAAESFTQVAVAHSGNILGTATFDPNNPYGLVDVKLGSGFAVYNGACALLELWAKFAAVKSSAQANNQWAHQPRSGKSVSLRIGEGVPQYGVTNACDVADFSGKLAIHARGLTSNEKVFADEGAAQPNFMVVRKTKIYVIRQNLANTILVNGEVELARLQVNADSAGPVALKQFVLYVSKTAGVDLSNFRLYRGASLLSSTDYHVTDAVTSSDLFAGAVAQDYTVTAISFSTEEIISGSGNVYSLRATAHVTGNQQYVVTGHIAYFTPQAEPVTGYLLNNDAYAPYVASPNVFNVGNYTGCGNSGPCWHAVGAFAWADNSDDPHSFATEKNGGSIDWTNEHLVEDLTHTWQLAN